MLEWIIMGALYSYTGLYVPLTLSFFGLELFIIIVLLFDAAHGSHFKFFIYKKYQKSK